MKKTLIDEDEVTWNMEQELVCRTSEIDRKGIFAKRFLGKNRILGVYHGLYEFEPDELNGFSFQIKQTLLSTKKPLYVNAVHVQHWTKYMNHSCDANVEGVTSYFQFKKIIFPTILIQTRREIYYGEELTLDYVVDKKDLWFKCKCKKCTQ